MGNYKVGQKNSYPYPWFFFHMSKNALFSTFFDPSKTSSIHFIEPFQSILEYIYVLLGVLEPLTAKYKREITQKRPKKDRLFSTFSTSVRTVNPNVELPSKMPVFPNMQILKWSGALECGKCRNSCRKERKIFPFFLLRPPDHFLVCFMGHATF